MMARKRTTRLVCPKPRRIYDLLVECRSVPALERRVERAVGAEADSAVYLGEGTCTLCFFLGRRTDAECRARRARKVAGATARVVSHLA